MTEAPVDYHATYSETGFWQKLQEFAKSAGRELVEKALWLFYAAQQSDAPKWAKAVIYGALGYFILPTDAIPDFTPIVGLSDDLGAITIAVATVAAYINEDVKNKARQKLSHWFGENAPSP